MNKNQIEREAFLAQPVLATIHYGGASYEARPNAGFCQFCDFKSVDGCGCGRSGFAERTQNGCNCEYPEFYPKGTVAWTRVVGSSTAPAPAVEPNPL